MRRYADLAWEARMAVRGGRGPARGADYLRAGDMEGIAAAGRTVLEPGSSIGDHRHADSAELYLILSGHGTGSLDGERFPVGPGDLFVVEAGHSHGLENGLEGPMAFIGVVTRRGGPEA